MEKFQFKKGDEVPQWIEKIDPPGTDLRMVFTVDVVAYRHEHGATVYPLREMEPDESVMKLEGEHKGAWITGAPTMVYQYPEGDPRNKFKPTGFVNA